MAKIIVADDQLLIRVIIREILEFEGHQVIDVDDGEQIIEYLKTEPVDLIITDIVMPKNGLETIMEVSRDHPEIPILAISGDELSKDIIKGGYLVMAHELGANFTLQKPIEKTQLLAAVNQLLEKSQ